MNYYFSLFLLLFSWGAYAQNALPADVNKKITFTDVVKTDNLKKEVIVENIKAWIASSAHTLQHASVDSATAKLTATKEFPVYARGYISKKIHGKISYNLSIEVKDGKYRYFFTDLVFHYYKEDRNFHMRPTGQTKPLENAKAQGWQSLWEQHKRTAQSTIENTITQLATAALHTPTPEKQITATKKTDTPAKDW